MSGSLAVHAKSHFTELKTRKLNISACTPPNGISNRKIRLNDTGVTDRINLYLYVPRSLLIIVRRASRGWGVSKSGRNWTSNDPSGFPFIGVSSIRFTDLESQVHHSEGF